MNLIKILKVVITILVLTLAFAITWRFTKPFMLRGTLFETRTTPTTFERYSTSMKSSADSFYVQYKDVVGGGIFDEPKQFILDITIETDSNVLAKQFNSDKARVVNEVRMAFADMENIDMASEEGRDMVKKEIKKRLSKAYNTNDIEEIYFENFVYR